MHEGLPVDPLYAAILEEEHARSQFFFCEWSSSSLGRSLGDHFSFFLV